MISLPVLSNPQSTKWGEWFKASAAPRLLEGIMNKQATGVILPIDSLAVEAALGGKVREEVIVNVDNRDIRLTPKRPASNVASDSVHTHITLIPIHHGLYIQEWLDCKPAEEIRGSKTIREALVTVSSLPIPYYYRLLSEPKLLLKPASWDVDHGFTPTGEGVIQEQPQSSVILLAEIKAFDHFDNVIARILGEEKLAILNEKGLGFGREGDLKRLHATILVNNPPGGLPVSSHEQLREFTRMNLNPTDIAVR